MANKTIQGFVRDDVTGALVVTGIAGGGGAETDPVATPALNTHIAATTNVHGVADMAALYPVPALRAGRYYVAPSASTTSAPSNGVVDYAPIVIGRGNIDQLIASVVTTAGEAGSQMRMGLLADNAGFPGAVLIDAGTILTDTTGNKAITITPFAITQAGLYWTAVHFTDAVTTRPTMQRYSSQLWPVTQNSVFTGNQYPGYSVAGALVSTALAANPAIVSAATQVTRVQLRGA